MGTDLSEVRKLVGKESGEIPAPDKVSKSDIRHWCEVMDEDRTPCHETNWGEKHAPPAMLMAWTMPPLWTPEPRATVAPHERALKALDEAGYDGAMGLHLDQEFFQPVSVGERLSYRVRVDGVSRDEVQTRMGSGIQVDLLYTISNVKGDAVSRQRYSLLKFKTLRPVK